MNRPLRLLNLQIVLHEDDACLHYEPRKGERLLPYDSAHGEPVQRNIVPGWLKAAIETLLII